MYSYISAADLPKGWDREKLLRRINATEQYTGPNVHHFLLAVGELSKLNPLAIGSLFLALSIDLLILFCGLMGARPDSYLDMRTPEELLDIQESSLEAVLSLDLDSIASAPYVDRFIARAAEILRNTTPDVEYAYQGFPAVLARKDIRRLKMSKEIGVLLALGLAKELPSGALGLRTRFVLWLAQRIHLYTEERETAIAAEQTIGSELWEEA